MKKLFFALGMVSLGIGVVANGGERMLLWPAGRIPDFQKHQFCAMDSEVQQPGFKKEEHARPYLEWFAPPTERNGACMLLLPGGAYIGCGSTNLVGEWNRTLTAAGYQCVCLVYRRPRPNGLPFYQSAWEDAQRAVRLIRFEAARRGYDAEKIGALGMSAGGHLGCLLATSALTPAYEPVDETDKLPCHLNWCVAMAPAYNTATGNEKGMQSPEDGKSVAAKISQVFKFDEKTCPMSLHHGGTDPWSPNGSSLMYRELHRRGIPAELHVFAHRYHGAHGLNRAMEFMRQMNFDGRLAAEAAAYVGRFPSNATAKVERELLWPEGRTPDRQAEQKYEPFLEWHLPKRFWTKSVMIVLPGGGYAGCGIEGDGIPAANYLNAHHMAAVIVRYRTPRPKGKPKHLLAWQDAQRAIRMVRSEAAARGCDPDHIGLLGFSAGGHLAVLCASSSQTPAYAPIDDIDKLSCRVQWAIPVYPAYALTDIAEDANVRGGCNEGDVPVPEFRFDSDTPPMCFFHGDEDTWSSMGSVRIWEKLRQMGIPADVHTLAKRGHCFMYKCSADTGSSNWLDYAWEFMGRAGCFARRERKADECEIDENLSVLISDIHIQTNPKAPYAFTAREFPKRVKEILAMRPLPRNVICFGDLTFDGGEPASYAFLREQIRPLEAAGIRVVLGMGNHDRRRNFLAAFPEAGKDQPVPGRIVHKVDLGHCDLILLDTLSGTESAVGGEFGAAQEDWLEREVKAAKRPVILGAHHLPEELRFRKKSLLSFMRGCDKVVGWINGHGHSWRKENLYWGGGPNEDVIRSLMLPTGGAWGEIGLVTLRTHPDRAVATLKMIDMVWHDALRPGERRPKSFDAIVEDQDGERIVFPYERPLLRAKVP